MPRIGTRNVSIPALKDRVRYCILWHENIEIYQ